MSHESDRRLLREGDSPRARFYRRKDEVLAGRAMPAIRQAMEADRAAGGRAGQEVLGCYADIRWAIHKLDLDENDSDAATVGTAAVDKLDELYRRAGV